MLLRRFASCRNIRSEQDKWSHWGIALVGEDCLLGRDGCRQVGASGDANTWRRGFLHPEATSEGGGSPSATPPMEAALGDEYKKHASPGEA
jgi:hypothetical protein